MKIFKNIKPIHDELGALKKNGAIIGFVPTMGFLHKGHTSLIQRSVKECDITAVSIFVNPIQFGKGEDFDSYPRNAQRDYSIIEETGAEYVFVPNTEEIYGEDFKTYVSVKGSGNIMCGKYRPGHFDGVCTVVLKLFNIINPDIAYFGLKDFQQFFIIKKMTEDLNVYVKIQQCPIVREEDGLAMSSRNRYLSGEERKNAVILYRTLKAAEEMVKGKSISLRQIKKVSLDTLGKNPYVKSIDYFDFRDPGTLEEIKNLKTYFKLKSRNKILIAAAIYIGSTRLIDNVVI